MKNALVVLAIAFFGFSLLNSCADSRKSSKADNEAMLAVPQQQSQSVPADTPTPGPTATPTPFSMVVANTGGQGVYIRKTTAASDKLKVWTENTEILVIGEDKEAEGRIWKNVKDPNGNVGWIPAEYLAVPTPTPAPTSTPDLSRYKLELLSSRGTWQYGFATVEGQVKNISNTTLRRVLVVAEWYTADGEFVKSHDALIDYDPILAGQTSPFKSITSYNPAMKRYSVDFKELRGGTIPTLDSRKR